MDLTCRGPCSATITPHHHAIAVFFMFTANLAHVEAISILFTLFYAPSKLHRRLQHAENLTLLLKSIRAV